MISEETLSRIRRASALLSSAADHFSDTVRELTKIMEALPEDIDTLPDDQFSRALEVAIIRDCLTALDTQSREGAAKLQAAYRLAGALEVTQDVNGKGVSLKNASGLKVSDILSLLPKGAMLSLSELLGAVLTPAGECNCPRCQAKREAGKPSVN